MQNQTIKINQTAINDVIHINKFQNAEELWLWFLYSKQTRAGYRGGAQAVGRCCELLDCEQMVTRLYLSGQLSDAQLSVMKQYGDKRRAPHQHIWAENRASALWRDAMATIEKEARKRGWVE